MTVPMNKIKKIVLTAIVTVAMVAVFSCKEKKPTASQPQVVKQKIATQPTQPAQKPAPVAEKDVAAKPQNPAETASPATSTPDKAAPGGEQPVSDLIKESMALASQQ